MPKKEFCMNFVIGLAAFMHGQELSTLVVILSVSHH